jgi:hypothetical protein
LRTPQLVVQAMRLPERDLPLDPMVEQLVMPCALA